MARKKEISIKKGIDGVIEVELAHWKHFTKFITRDILKFDEYIFRGQSKYSWKLESSFDRIVRTKKIKAPDLEMHLNAFKNTAKGRGGNKPPMIFDDNEWWALAQHYGLATPLLDFTRSAFVALYFAFWDETDKGEFRAVHAIQAHALQRKFDNAVSDGKIEKTESIDLFFPSFDGNERLINQSGLFIKLPVKSNLETIIKNYYKGTSGGALLKIKIPNTDISGCLTMLNRMNINHATLFPDLYGAAKFVNCLLDKPKYDSIGKLNKL